MKLLNNFHVNMKSRIIKFLQKKNFHEYALLGDHLLESFSLINRKEILTSFSINSKESGISNTRYCNDEIIISLTTYGNRLYEVYLSIESIMQQTVKPNRIILWLSDDLKSIALPVLLQNQIKRGLEIKFCKDIKSYKKLIPALIEFPSSSIITVDDDELYHCDLIENFIKEHMPNPKLILCSRMHLIKLNKNKKPDKYSKWYQVNLSPDISPLNFPTGCGGILYPPNCFNNEVFNENVFMDICPYADDIWFKAMSLLNNVSSKKIYTHNKKSKEYLSNDQDSNLYDINVGKKMNDIQLKKVFDKYNLYEKLITNYE